MLSSGRSVSFLVHRLSLSSDIWYRDSPLLALLTNTLRESAPYLVHVEKSFCLKKKKKKRRSRSLLKNKSFSFPLSLLLSPPLSTTPLPSSTLPTKRIFHTHSLGVLVAASSFASGDPSSTLWQYSHRADSGSDIRIDSTRPAVLRPKVVPLSYTRLYSA